ncbi:uncharacterized protein UV8b_07588 [Ustilaginoidea virens]|uniref:Uncharacterized protein n=1 Tax=Ustilaginoidea virens TaxID=1159556 RepID=A0A8E5ML55_USTVR|nr:uncharacterized protein UV8b_07588 [Ustilaginoidea virens]QUC23347.1 hypothetical protein UV8b_07588 [Ustilaginoidea virens]
MSKYLLTEPSPSTTSYVRCGRGGAGNTFRASSSEARTTAVSPTAKKTPSSGRFFSGIGGAGNAHPAAELPSAAASLDDALRHAAKRDNAPVGYCGRGGAGNIYRRKDSDAASASTASSAASVKSSMSSTANLWKRVSGSFGRD